MLQAGGAQRALWIVAMGLSAVAFADSRFDFKADKYSTNVDTGLTHATGGVEVYFKKQVLAADVVDLNTKTQKVLGQGNVSFTEGRLSIKSESADFAMDVGLGKFTQAVLEVKDEIYVEAHVLERYQESRYRAINGKLSPCMNCPQDWSIEGTWIDLELEGYAEIHNALIQVRDVPVMYVPLLIFPIKTKRQTGFLIPQISYSNELGTQLHVPFFWAHSDSSDSTHEYQFIDKAGHRLTNEFRYVYSDRSRLGVRASVLKNTSLPALPDLRYGFSATERFQITPRITQRLQSETASDTRYTRQFEGDFPSYRFADLVNEPSLTYQDTRQYAWLTATLARDNLPRLGPREEAIHRLPYMGYAVPSEQIVGPVRGDFGVEAVSFYRRSGGLDPNTNWLRGGNRGTLTGRLFAPLPLSSFVNWTPRVDGRSDVYSFPDRRAGDSAGAARGRLIVSQELSTEIFRVFSVGGSDLKAVKHGFQPSLRWSYSPPEIKTDHQFFDLNYSPRFDLFDPASPDVSGLQLGSISDEQRLRPHHLLTWSLVQRVVGRYGEANRSYTQFLSASLSQDINLKRNLINEYRLSPLFLTFTGAYGAWSVTSQLAFNSNTGKTSVVNEMAFAKSRYRLGALQNIQPGTEVYGLSGSLSALGPWSLGASATYNAFVKQMDRQVYSADYTSPSKCWIFSFALTQKAGTPGFAFDPLIRVVFSESIKKGSVY
jgi:hypothetical protein